MKKIVLILLAFLSFTVQAQFIVFTIGGGPSTQDGDVDSTAFDRFYVTETFKLGSGGLTIAEIDTSNVAALTDTIRFYITGSAQPAPVVVASPSLDTSFQVGVNGIVIDSITLNTGEITWYSGGVGKTISEIIYTVPNAPTTLTISSPDSDTLTYAVSIFGSPANGTVSDSCTVRWDTAAIPTAVTDGYRVYLGDTPVAETDFFIDMADSLEVYVSAFAKNDGTLGTGTWSVAKTDSVFIDSTGVVTPSYNANYQVIYDTLVARGATPVDSIAGFQDAMVYSLDTAGTSIYAANLWDNYLDALWMIQYDSVGGKTEWISLNPTYTITLNGSATFDLNEGLTFGGTTSDYGNTQWDASNDGVNYTQNDAFNGVYLTTITAQEMSFVAGTGTGAAASNGISPDYGGSHTFYGSANTVSESSWNGGGAAGFYAVDRAGVSLCDLYLNGVKVVDDTDASQTPLAYDWYVGALNNANTSVVFPTTHEISILVIGGSLGATLQGYLNEILEKEYYSY